jgi:hypothetical protein
MTASATISSVHMMTRRPMRFVRDVIGSCLIAPTVTHAGIVGVKRYGFDMPDALENQMLGLSGDTFGKGSRLPTVRDRTDK